MAETLLSDAKLHAELEFVRQHAEVLGANKVQHASNYVPPLEHRHKKPTLVNVPVVEPPAGSNGDDDDEEPADKTINLTIKSLKPALTFTLPCIPTATINSLKQQLADQDQNAPPAEQQRWILKGKAMAGDRLLKDFAVEEGAVVNLMVAKPPATATPIPVETTPTTSSSATLAPAATPAPAKLSPPASPSSGPPPPERHTHRSVPSLTLSFSDAPSLSPGASAASSPGGEHPPLNVVTSLPLDVDMQDASPMYEQPPFNAKVSDPALWEGAWELLQRHFGEDKEGEAHLAWEAWLAGSREYITPSDKALIRHKVGLSAMGGV